MPLLQSAAENNIAKMRDLLQQPLSSPSYTVVQLSRAQTINTTAYTPGEYKVQYVRIDELHDRGVFEDFTKAVLAPPFNSYR